MLGFFFISFSVRKLLKLKTWLKQFDGVGEVVRKKAKSAADRQASRRQKLILPSMKNI